MLIECCQFVFGTGVSEEDLILNTVSDLIDGQMICGAGGGGFLQVVLKKGITADTLRARLREVYQDSGVDVWQCAFA